MEWNGTGNRVFDLRRGGVVIHTTAGTIQFGISPETIKDTMELDCGVPEVFLVPRNLFLEDQGISMADLEFPIYYNFFFRGKKTRVICSKDQRRKLRAIIQEAVFGPSAFKYLASDYPDGEASVGFPDFRKELDYFAQNAKTGKRLALKDLVTFLVFDDEQRVVLGETEVLHQDPDWFTIRDRGEDVALVPSRIFLLPRPMKVGQIADFQPPLFGLTIIGTGTGFDPSEMTSGFILWVNRHGILVDPPVETTAWMEANRIDPRMIHAVIITHCHADHDAGTLQMILDEGRIKLITTRTILESFTRKYRALLDLAPGRFRMLFDFQAVKVNEPVHLYGARFEFRYTFHSVPTIMFEVHSGGKSLVYTADHCNDPELINKLHKEGIFPEGRRDELLNFPWDHDLILHEAGPPPIHTPLSALENLSPQTKKKIRLVHVSKQAVTAESGLQLAASGLENTICFDVAESKVSLAMQILDALTRIDFLSDLSLGRARRFLELVRVERFEPDMAIIRKGTPGDKFYMVLEGTVGITLDGKSDLRRYGKNDYFGETAIILGQKRNAHVIARSTVTCITMLKSDFLKFLEGTDVVERLKRIARNRRRSILTVLTENSIFSELTPAQRTDLESIVIRRTFKDGEILIENGKRGDCAMLVEQGELLVESNEGLERIISRGELVGVIPVIRPAGDRRLIAVSRGTVLMMPAVEMEKFFRRYPGLLIQMEKHFR